MRFSAAHKTVSYLMCASAFLALALSHELSMPLVAVVVTACALSWFVEPSRFEATTQGRWTGVWNVATILAFAFCALEAIRGELLVGGVQFICFLIVNKLFNRQKSKDYLHAYVLSFLMLVAGAALSADLTYAVCFLLYVVFATWTLTLFHLRREMEDNYLLKHSDDAQSERVEVERVLNSRRIIGGSFLAGTALVSVGISIVATIAFFLIPRFGFGFFANGGRKSQPTVGFTDRVELGEYGQIQDNPQVVLRVELPNGLPQEPLHFRGVVFDHYQGGHWTRTTRIEPTSLARRGRMSFLAPQSTKLDAATRDRMLAGAIEQDIYLDPLDTGVLFGASAPIAFELPPVRPGINLDFEGRHGGEVYAIEGHVDIRGHMAYTERKSAMRYTVYSRLAGPPIGRLLDDASFTGAEPPAEMRTYLTLPPLPERMKELARALVAGHKTRYAQAHAVEQYLRTRLRYTLDLKRDDRYEPIEDFLFVQKAGHCEYFASSMAILLRSVGIPTRMVSGFYGGEWNEYGKYLAVRQRDAHAWVEVWLGEAGWVTFDPTPAGVAGVSVPGIGEKLRLMLDTVELAWFKYVIEYDLGKQVDAVLSARRAVGEMSAGSGLERARKLAPKVLWLAVIVGGIIVLRRARFRGPKITKGDRLLLRAMNALDRRGLHRRIGETPRELGRRATEANDAGAPAFAEFVVRYYAARYGAEPSPKAELEALVARVVKPPIADIRRRAA